MYEKLRPGAFELFAGPMYSSKTDGLIRRIDDIEYLTGVDYLLFKPEIDTRDPVIVSAYSKKEYVPLVVHQDRPEDVLKRITPNIRFVGFDEVQFFHKNIRYVIEQLQLWNINVVAAGLNTNFEGNPFGPMPDLMAIATHITIMSGVCQYAGCNNPGIRTQRFINGIPSSYNTEVVKIEDKSRKTDTLDKKDNEKNAVKKDVITYETRCLKHHEVLGKPSLEEFLKQKE